MKLGQELEAGTEKQRSWRSPAYLLSDSPLASVLMGSPAQGLWTTLSLTIINPDTPHRQGHGNSNLGKSQTESSLDDLAGAL